MAQSWMRGRPCSTGTGVGALLMLLALTFVPLAQGSHFRYGTLSWKLIPNSESDGPLGRMQSIKFSLLAAYRRDYEWGSNFQEQWSQTSTTNLDKVYYGNEYWMVKEKGDRSVAGYDESLPGCKQLEDGSSEAEIMACFRCPGGRGVAPFPANGIAGIDARNVTVTVDGCVNTGPMFDLGVANTNGNSLSNEKFSIKFPSKKQANGVDEIVQCPTPFYCDMMGKALDGSWVNQEAQNAACTEYELNPARDASKCAPWDQVYGMFTGDENGKSIDIDFEVTSMTESVNKGPAVGNYLRGKSTFDHAYKLDSDQPYVAYFTGGDRVYECAGGNLPPYGNGYSDSEGRCTDHLQLMLNNNAEGRFRLETTVWLKELFKAAQSASPRVTMMPIIPLPRGTDAAPANRFQVAAYDPDDGDDSLLRFRFGNSAEYGGIMRSKTAAYPFSENPGQGALGGGFVYGPFGCDKDNKFYARNGTCPEDRTPEGPKGAIFLKDTSTGDIDNAGGVPGLIEWRTYDTAPQKTGEWCPETNSMCTKLRTGLYNFVVMVEDVPTSAAMRDAFNLEGAPEAVVMSKAPVDFMAYLYDGPMYYCNAACQNGNPGVRLFTSIEGFYGSESTETCAVCGAGVDASANNSPCDAREADGVCGELGEDGVSLVPTASACVMNQPPRFYQPAETYRWNNGIDDPVELDDTPEVEKWTRANAELSESPSSTPVEIEGGFAYPSITQYFGTTVEFFVTVYDPDECTDLVIESTHLPDTGGQQATLSAPIPRTTNRPNNVGTMVSRMFRWTAPSEDEQDLPDPTQRRDGKTRVCFVATDDYFATADPFYCVTINLKEKPNADEQTLLRFDCKMALLWSPVVQRFVYAGPPGTPKYYTMCRYDNFMWHHAMVAVNEAGHGSLYVDGVAQELMIPKMVTDLSQGFEKAPLDTVFEAATFPQECSTYNLEGGVSFTRKLQQHDMYVPHEATDQFNDFTDSPVDDAFVQQTVSSEDMDPRSECCSFAIGSQCGGSAGRGGFQTFEGFIDEVAVWNRVLRPEEVKSTLFHMPQKARSRDLENARGVQIDYTAGRVLYARFNNPCMESPQQQPPPPAPPPVLGEGSFGSRRRLQQISDHEIELFDGGDRPEGLTWGPPPPQPSGVDWGRREYVSDKAGYTSGWILPNGTRVFPTDTFNPANYINSSGRFEPLRASLHTDAVFMRNFPKNNDLHMDTLVYATKYAYTGVPWEPPMVTDVTAANITDDGMGVGFSADAWHGPLPIDGKVKIRVSGVGFARSSFAKCMLVQPDPAGLFKAPMGYDNEDKEVYNNYYRNAPGATISPTFAFDYEELTSQVVKTPAKVVWGEGNNIPFISYNDFHAPTKESAFDLSQPWVRDGHVNAFQEDPNDSHRYDFVYGTWEIVECEAPAAAFPSNKYHFAVSNDAGMTGSPPMEMTVMDYSIYLPGGNSFFEVDDIKTQLGQTFTISFWFYPTAMDTSSDLLDLGAGNRVVLDGTVKLLLDDKAYHETPYPPANATFGMNMWHHVTFVADYDLEGGYGTAGVYVDVDPTISIGGGDFTPASSRTFSGFAASGPSLVKFGFNFNGYMDEVKMWKRAVPFSELTTSQIAFARELPETQSTGVFAYYRFNNITLHIDAYKRVYDEFGQFHGDVTGNYQYHPMEVPWEPSSIYTVNAFDAGSEGELYKEPHTGLDTTLTVEGFNMASYFGQACFWGVEEDMKVPAAVMSTENQPYNCDIPEGDELDLTKIDSVNGIEQSDYLEMSLGRPDNRSSIQFPYPAMYINATTDTTALDSLVKPPAYALSTANTVLTCKSPTQEAAHFAYFSAGNVPTLVTVPYEFAEVALECSGENYLAADAVSSLVGDGGYTFGAWVMPAASEADGDAGTASTVLAFESTDFNAGLIGYRGDRFFYYDDCIKDVTQVEVAAPADQWHFVMVSIGADGASVLNVDGAKALQFSTTCRPEASSRFSVCQDYTYDQASGEDTPGNLFAGKVDEIMVFDKALPYEHTLELMFLPYPLEATGEPVAYFTFSDALGALPHGAVMRPMGETGMLATSSGPWTNATVVGVEPAESSTSGGTPLTVFGANFAPSQFARVNFGGDDVEVVEFRGSSVVARTTAMPECEGVRQVAVKNNQVAATPSVVNSAVTYTPDEADLARGVYTRYTFDYVETVNDALVETEGLLEVHDHAGNSAPFRVPMASLASDKDLFQLSAVEFGEELTVALPMPPETEEYTVCAWVFMFINEQEAPWAGGWKLVCLVNMTTGTTVYQGPTALEKEEAQWYEDALADNALGGAGESGYLGDVWVYDRALLPCDVAARYYTQEYSLDFVKGADRLREDPAYLTLNLPAGPLRFNLEMWIFPYHTEGLQTIASTDASIQAKDIENTQLGLHFGLLDNAMTFQIHKGCKCQPCPGVISMTSWKSKITPQRWQHVSFIFPFAEGYAVNDATLAIHVDGVLRDVREFRDVTIPDVEKPTAVKLLLGQGSTEEFNRQPYAGLVYDVRWTNSSYYNYLVKTTMQCPPLSHQAETYFELNEGSGSVGAAGAAQGLQGLWTNSSYDDLTSPESVTLYGDMDRKVSGEVGRFVITSRTACAKKRVSGGDDYNVTMSGSTMAASLPVVDRNDGNYHVEYAGFTCDEYIVTVELEGEFLHQFPVTVFPGRTDPAKTHVVGDWSGVPVLPPQATPACYGVQSEFFIQAVDYFGCHKQDDQDVFHARLDGPHTIDAIVTPVGEGRYRVTYVAEAPGQYHLTLWMEDGGEAVAIGNGMYHCVEVCAGGALELRGTRGVRVQEDYAGISDLDLAFPGVTMELWVKVPPGFNPTRTAYFVSKGGSDQEPASGAEPPTKSYHFGISRTDGIEAGVYVGHGQMRTVSVTLVNASLGSSWVHLAAVYDGVSFGLYKNGEPLMEPATWAENKPVKTNLYHHPLELGIAFEGGLMDDVVLWKVARTPDEVRDAMYCAPYKLLDDVAAYFSFNYPPNARVLAGHSMQCPPMGALSTVAECMNGAVDPEVTDARYVADNPIDGTLGEQEGYYRASPRYSLLTGAGLSTFGAASLEPMFRIDARDKCNYRYTKNDTTAYSVRTQEYQTVYWDARAPFGTEYPVTTAGAPSPRVYAAPAASRQCPGDSANATDPPGRERGDVFTGLIGNEAVNPTTKAGTYLLHLEVDQVLVSEPTLMTVVADVPHHFDVSSEAYAGFAAGVPGALKVLLKDKNDNTVYVKMPFTAEVTLLASAAGASATYADTTTVLPQEMAFDPETGYYSVFVNLGHPGSYSLMLVGSGASASATPYTSALEVKPAAWRKMLTNELTVPTPTRRFEHSSAEYNGDVYIFGGVLYDRTYLNDMYVLRGAGATAHNGETRHGETNLAYRKEVAVHYALTEERDVTVEVRVNTAELIAANRMNPSCLDVLFTMPSNGDRLHFYLDMPTDHPSVAGACNTTETLYWVRLPAGALPASRSAVTIEMYYGNPHLGVTVPNEYNDPKAVFMMYEGFEAGALEQSIFRPAQPCGGAEESLAGDTFAVMDEYPWAGKFSLYAKWGGMGVLAAPASAAVTNFKLRAWFYDSAATNSSHFVSPDFTLCDETMESDTPMLPGGIGHLEGGSTAVGTYTMSHTTKFCVASPWESTVNRSAGWHLLEVEAVSGALTVRIDDAVVKQAPPVADGPVPMLDKVMLSAGLNAYGLSYPGLHASHAYWDELSVALVEPGVEETVAAAMTDDEPVNLADDVEGRQWYKLPVAAGGAAPPPRYAHSAVVHEDAMYVFGGERSGYAFNDVWRYSFASESWSFVTPATGASPAPRYDHSAVVTADGQMIVYGGRNYMTLLGDIWALDLATATWRQVAEASQAGARFGHSAALVSGTSDMYVFGGYAVAGFSNDFIKCDVMLGACTNLTYGCAFPEVAPLGPDAHPFLPATLTARYEHTSFADDRFVYVYGGASITNTSGFGGVYKFAVKECAWEEVPTSTAPPERRYEHVSGLVGGGFYVQGGHAGGNYFDETYYFPV